MISIPEVCHQLRIHIYNNNQCQQCDNIYHCKEKMVSVSVCVVDRVQRQEREVMLKLKQVVDKQRDELRAKVQEITTISKEVEAVRKTHMNGDSSVDAHTHFKYL